MRLITPALGALTLSKDSEPDLFNLAKVGLGALGVVTQVRGIDHGTHTHTHTHTHRRVATAAQLRVCRHRTLQ